MTTFKALENNYVTLTEAELMDTEGGIEPFTAGLFVGGALAIGAAIWSVVKK